MKHACFPLILKADAKPFLRAMGSVQQHVRYSVHLQHRRKQGLDYDYRATWRYVYGQMRRMNGIGYTLTMGAEYLLAQHRQDRTVAALVQHAAGIVRARAGITPFSAGVLRRNPELMGGTE